MAQFIKFDNLQYPGEEWEIRITASNGKFSGYQEIYCDTEDIEKFATSLKDFPKSLEDQYRFEFGSEKEADNWAFYFLLRPYVPRPTGNCAIQIRINNNRKGIDKNLVEFSILAEAASLNRLGHLLTGFSKKEELSILWEVENRWS